MKLNSKKDKRLKIRKRIRSKIFGTESVPRLAVFRSNNEIYAQIINDDKGHTLFSSTSLNLKALPIGLANDMYLKNDINKDKIITWNDVEFDSNDEIINYRHQMENKFRN